MAPAHFAECIASDLHIYVWLPRPRTCHEAAVTQRHQHRSYIHRKVCQNYNIMTNDKWYEHKLELNCYKKRRSNDFVVIPRNSG